MTTNPPWMRAATQFVQNNSTTILSSAAVAGVVATVALAVKATPKAIEDVTTAQENKELLTPVVTGDNNHHARVKLTPWEVMQAGWKPFLPSAIMGSATIVCIIGANAIGLRRNAALVAAYAIADRTFLEYRDKIAEKLGEKEERQIRDEIAQDRISAAPPPVIIMGRGETICLDMFTGRYFRSDVEDIRRAVNDFNQTVLNDHCAGLNVFWEYLGMDPVLVGEQLGYNTDKLLDIDITSALIDGITPCIAINYRTTPRADYEVWG